MFFEVFQIITSPLREVFLEAEKESSNLGLNNISERKCDGDRTVQVCSSTRLYNI